MAKRRRTADDRLIEDRGDGQYRVKVRRGRQSASRTFDDLNEARQWRDQQLALMRAGKAQSIQASKQVRLRTLASAYKEKRKPTAKDQSLLRVTIRRIGSDVTISDLSPQFLADFRDRREAEEASAQQIRHELGMVRRILNWGMRERGLRLDGGNPVEQIDLPRVPKGRDRRLRRIGARVELTEEHWLRHAMNTGHSDEILPLFVLAVETGMRLGEIAGLRRSDVDWDPEAPTAFLRKTKSLRGEPRTRVVPLSPAAVEALENRPVVKDENGRKTDLFWRSASDHYSQVWREQTVPRARRAYLQWCEREGVAADGRFLVDLHFHDLRHEAAFRLARRFKALDLTKIFGWSTMDMALRYYQADARDFARRLREPA